MGHLQVVGEAVQSAIPSSLMVVARSHCFENAVVESQPGLGAEILKSHGHDRFGTRGPGEDDPLGRQHLAIDSLPMVVVIWPLHVEVIGATGAHIVSNDGG